MTVVRFTYEIDVEIEEDVTDDEIIAEARERLEELIANEGFQAIGEIVPSGE